VGTSLEVADKSGVLNEPLRKLESYNRFLLKMPRHRSADSQSVRQNDNAWFDFNFPTDFYQFICDSSVAKKFALPF
jgi:hypothetical protein